MKPQEARRLLETVTVNVSGKSFYECLSKVAALHGKATIMAALETLPPDVGEQFEVQGLTVGDWNTRMSEGD